MPKSVNEALDIDNKNGESYWKDAIEAEMKRLNDDFELYEGDTKNLIGYQKITTHSTFDIKPGENFRRKARFIADGHKIQTPRSLTYSSVVSRYLVSICLFIAALNDLDILGSNIENTYLTASCCERV